MPSDDYRGEPRGGVLPGFDTNADDTPRDGDPYPREARSWERQAPPLIVAPPPADAAWVEPEAYPTPRRLWPVAAVGAALAVAFGAGVLIAPNNPGPSAVQVEAAAPPMNVEVAAVKPAPIPSVAAVGKLDVLPRYTEPRRAPSPPLQAPTIALPAAEPPRELALAAPGRDASATTPPPVAAAPPARRSFACRDAPTRARRMVCEDMRLAALDRQMKQAYAAAIAAGASPGALAADQDEWLSVREDAAGHSRFAVASIYRQRIDELHDLADGAPR